MITLRLVECTTRDAIGATIHYYPVVKLAGPTPVQWHGHEYLAVATDWDAAGVRQMLVVDGGLRVPAVEAVIRRSVGDAVYDQLPAPDAFDLITQPLLRGVDVYRQHAADGVHLTVDSAKIEPLHFADRFMRAHSPDVPVIFRQRAADAGTVLAGNCAATQVGRTHAC